MGECFLNISMWVQIPPGLNYLTLYEPRNVDYTLHTDQKATVYVQENPFTYDFIYDKMLKISIQIVNHIMEKINDKKR